jgi:DNA polymerase eta
LSTAADLPFLSKTQETGFTVSAGIAHNKMWAKLASSRNKPNKQTIVPASAVPALMGTIPLKEIRGLGGKLGDAVLAFLDEKAGVARGPQQQQGQGQQQQQQQQQRMAVELQAFSEAELRSRFGAKEGAWLHRICRGVSWACWSLSLC